MALYEMNHHAFKRLEQCSMVELGISERNDLQRLLRTQIEVLDEDLYVLAEEFSEWEESRRRIDLLAIDREANLVVIELKRTHDGGHMELQAIRYAAMISTMTIDRAIQIHRQFLTSVGEDPESAETKILGFLGWSDKEEETFAEDVRVLLVSENFGKELTTAVLWLRDRDLDIRCIRLRPFKEADKTLVDVQQIIPLPEAAEYQIQLREKEIHERRKRIEQSDIKTQFWEGLIHVAQKYGTRHGKIKPGPWNWIGASSGINGLGFNFVIRQHGVSAELYINRQDSEANLQFFKAFEKLKESIEKQFGEPLIWDSMEGLQACRIRWTTDLGGYKSPRTEWSALHEIMISKMTELERALGPIIQSLN